LSVEVTNCVYIFIPSRQRHCVFGLSVRASVRPLTPISRDAISLYLVGRFFGETCRKYSSCEWELLKRLSRSEVRNQVHVCTNVWMLLEMSTGRTARGRTARGPRGPARAARGPGRAGSSFGGPHFWTFSQQ